MIIFCAICELGILISQSSHSKIPEPRIKKSLNKMIRNLEQKVNRTQKSINGIGKYLCRRAFSKIKVAHFSRKWRHFYNKIDPRFWQKSIASSHKSAGQGIDHPCTIFHPKVIIFASFLIEFDVFLSSNLIKSGTKMITFE